MEPEQDTPSAYQLKMSYLFCIKYWPAVFAARLQAVLSSLGMNVYDNLSLVSSFVKYQCCACSTTSSWTVHLRYLRNGN